MTLDRLWGGFRQALAGPRGSRPKGCRHMPIAEAVGPEGGKEKDDLPARIYHN